MAEIGRPKREIYIEPITNPVPQKMPAVRPEPIKAPAPARPEMVPA